MSNPLRLFLKTPYTAWTLVHGYGQQQPAPASGPIFHYATFLETAAAVPAGGDLVAACAGSLSRRPPQIPGRDRREELVEADNAQSVTGAVTLYIHLTPNEARRAAFRDRAAGMEGLHGFMYENVDVASLEGALAELLDSAVFPPGSATRSEIVQMLVRGDINVPVIAGHALGNASTLNATAGRRRVGFAAITNDGPMDASNAYDWMRDFVADGQPAVDDYLAVAPVAWPVINSALTSAAKITLTETALYSWTALKAIKSALTPDEWRTVRDNQKRIFRARLYCRRGLTPPDASQAQYAFLGDEPPFEFNDKDFKNLFQLEAIVEFYINFEDPWITNATPVLTTAATYRKVDLISPSGSAATTGGGAHVVLDGTCDLTRLTPNHDTIRFENDTGRQNKLYRITAVNTSSRTVTLDAAPAFSGSDSPWSISLRPVLIVIDAHGGYLKGNNATVADSSEPAVVTLDGLPAQPKLNIYFDTIYLPEDTARASRTYRIIEKAGQTVTLDGSPTLTGGTSGTGSKWHIPAGLSGEIPDSARSNLGPGGTEGWDHYAGSMFTVFDDVIHNGIIWTSYTSRNETGDAQTLSSIKGNDGYRFASIFSQRSPSDPSGAAATVAGNGQTLHLDGNDSLSQVLNKDIYLDTDGGRATKRYKIVAKNVTARTVTLDGMPDLTDGTSAWRVTVKTGSAFRNYCFSVKDTGGAYDGVRRARFYFDETVTEDTAVAPAVPNVLGKTGIRIHNGTANGATSGTGSAGCLVSFAFYSLRDRLIELYQGEYAAWRADLPVAQRTDTEVQKLAGLGAAASTLLWHRSEDSAATAGQKLTDGNWAGKIRGTLWLIRPDERSSLP